MLIIAESLAQLDFDALMDIYVEGNRENGERLWPEKPEEDGMTLAKREFHRYLMEQFLQSPVRFTLSGKWMVTMSALCGWNHTGMGSFWRRWRPDRRNGKRAML